MVMRTFLTPEAWQWQPDDKGSYLVEHHQTSNSSSFS